MKRSEVKDFIPLLKAWADGKTIQYRSNCREGDWQDLPGYEDDFDTNRYEYRIKPEPREWYEIDVPNNSYLGFRFSTHDEAHVHAIKAGLAIGEFKIIKVREVTE